MRQLGPVLEFAQKQLGGSSAESGQIEARALYMWRREGTLLDPTVGEGSAPLLKNLRFLISKRRTFVNC